MRGSAKAPANDPLAELARLIGQTDPFGEFGRDSARRAPAPQSDERSDWNTQPLGMRYTPTPAPDPRAGVPPQRSAGNGYYAARTAPAEQQFDATQSQHGAQSYGRQTYGSAPSTDEGRYQTDQDARGYPSGQADYQQEVEEVQDGQDVHGIQEAYDQDFDQQTDDEYYEDMPVPRRRLGIMAIVGVIALAVIGTAGAFGYRALFGSSGSPQPPPVIKADAGPNKVVPATAGRDAQSNKLITDRVNERGQSEKLVSREEQPIDKPAAVVLSQAPQQSALGSGVVGSEPKKVRTIAIHPDQSAVADASAQGGSPLAAAAAPARSAPAPAAKPSAPPPPPPPARAANNTTADAEDDAAPAQAPRSGARPAAPGNAPLSLNPDTSARAAAPPTRAAAVAPPAQAAPPAASSAGGPGTYVQVSSQRSEAEAQSAFRGLQAKYPDQLGGRPLQVLKVELGSKGTYYRAMVGPFANASEAAELCSSLKSAGGQCLIQRN